MKVYVTFDYELFFGSKTGTTEKCLIKPTELLLQMAEKHQAKFTFFVDVLYLIKLKSYAYDPKLCVEFDRINSQLKEIIALGHDVQLHLHTHWINANYTDGYWNLDYKHYRIHSFQENEIEAIVSLAVDFLEDITKRKVFAFRAGGWCLQPFEKLKEAFIKKEIWLDSTVFHKGYNETPNNLYDFRLAPNADIWNFNSDPLKVESGGIFTELPITSCNVSPLFYWKAFLLNRIYAKRHLQAGDGRGIVKSRRYLLRLLLKSGYTAVSCDGYKASLLAKAFNESLAAGKDNFVIIGHPKLLSIDALENLDNFISHCTKQGHTFSSLHDSFGKYSTARAKRSSGTFVENLKE